MLRLKLSARRARCLVRCDGKLTVLTPCCACRKPLLIAVSLDKMIGHCSCGVALEADMSDLLTECAA